MGVHDDHRRRVYERFLREGLAGFEEHNAMEFLLFLARPRGDTNPLAHALIDRFGSLSAVLDAPIEELERVPGVGHSSAVVLKIYPADVRILSGEQDVPQSAAYKRRRSQRIFHAEILRPHAGSFLYGGCG